MRSIASTWLAPVLGSALLLAACGTPDATRRTADPTTASRMARGGGEQSAPRGAGNYHCGDPVLNDQVTSGGEPLTTWIPCWDAEEEIEHARRVADESRPGARSTGNADLLRARETHRGELAAAELVHCKGIPETELTHSPLAHRKAIAEVIPHRRQGKLHGVRIVFRAVPGLTADFLSKAIKCHQARHETLGRPAGYLPEDPTLVAGAEVRVTEYRGVVEVFILAPDPEAGRLAFDRASELARPRAATR